MLLHNITRTLAGSLPGDGGAPFATPPAALATTAAAAGSSSADTTFDNPLFSQSGAPPPPPAPLDQSSTSAAAAWAWRLLLQAAVLLPCLWLALLDLLLRFARAALLPQRLPTAVSDLTAAPPPPPGPSKQEPPLPASPAPPVS